MQKYYIYLYLYADFIIFGAKFIIRVMAAPYPILIRKKKNNGTTTAVVNTETAFGMVASEIPFHFAGDVKEPYKNDWHDEDGVETYLSDEGLFFNAYDMEVTFLYKGQQNSFSGNLRDFLDFLSGKDGDGARLTIYDTYNNVGRNDVYFKSISPDVFVKQNVSNNANGQEIASFKVTFNVGDPVTDVVLT